MSEAGSLARRWWRFVRERHHPATHLAMGAAFACGNAGAAATLAGRGAGAGRLALATFLAMVFFLRLRIFDEIKDYVVDRTANPARPLPRGVVSLAEARRAAWILAGVELAVSLALGRGGVWAWALASLYSLAMYREFWAGTWLRPRMELYALTHTLVAALLGAAVGAWALGRPFWALPAALALAAPANWGLFNVFEFSRKTFAPEEERRDVESYSSRWGPRGAVALTAAWAAVALACAAAAGLRAVPGLTAGAGTALFGLTGAGLCLPYLLRPVPRHAACFRASMSGWATALYLGVGAAGLGRW